MSRPVEGRLPSPRADRASGQGTRVGKEHSAVRYADGRGGNARDPGGVGDGRELRERNRRGSPSLLGIPAVPVGQRLVLSSCPDWS